MHHKHRVAVVQYWRSLILREARDLYSLEQIAARAHHDPEVRDDEEVRRQIECEIEERKLEFLPLRTPTFLESRAFMAMPALSAPVEAKHPTDSRQVVLAFERLKQSLRTLIDHKEEPEARTVLGQMRRMQSENAELLSSVEFDLFEHALHKLAKRLRHVADQINVLTLEAIEASKDGDEATVAQLSRRLSSIHTTYPRLLDDARLEEIRELIVEASDEHVHQLAAQKLIQRERAIAKEVRLLAVAVHRFHHIAQTERHDSPVYLKAEREYHKTVADVRSHNMEWLASFTMELADLLAEWGHPLEAEEAKVDHFLQSVQTVLERTKAEINEIQSELGEERMSKIE